MERLGFRAAALEDAPILAGMNRELIVDEGSRNPMNREDLIARMRGWLQSDWRAIIILVNDSPVGYCLYQERRDEYDPDLPVIYVRQFFIMRRSRRRGVGRRAFNRIADVVYPDEATIELDILAGNGAGQAFWASLGFAPHQTLVRRRAQPLMPRT